MSFQPIAVPPIELEMRRFTIEEIARVFNVPIVAVMNVPSGGDPFREADTAFGKTVQELCAGLDGGRP